MPKPALTDNQRALLGFVNRERLGPGQEIDTSVFGKLMLQPEYVDLVRRSVNPNESWDIPGDSAAFYDKYRSRVVDQAPLRREDVKEPYRASSREGRYDTIRYPALGDQPAHETVEFRPSVLQHLRDAAGAVPGALQDAAAPFRGLLDRALAPAPLDAVSGAAAKPKLTERSKRTGL